ncbi:MAG: AAA-like domain-containing protein [Roseofilum sp. SBFL]|uniref:AAA-like domain-containing protein n=1 Tax=unclassified Roseofilum TaxID=2620099 RepID=UPI001AFD0A2C|nr:MULTISPECIES: AAA-like domain-containing protein [unclassified Roseofilum]MBP0012536.1 AAA-like domain-containing protein [Roseofilum sp. SID3]MBP0024874.1 AAA-like domain-containing protein [Roseofilum sp. SID2]MBP0037555.1 AAA-like domain-containing protein [Roseofilum sp. SID1]MBP0041887.1 AAA-like domain-containing protein [Roseofilum sp. SBFL]
MNFSSEQIWSIEAPYSPVPIGSPFYIERFPIEEEVCTELEKPGSLIRIKAPHKMGKSSLLIRIIAHAQSIGYPTVTIDFQEIDESIYTNLNRFLRWFCIKVTLALKLPNELDEYWDQEIGSKASSTLYLEEYILQHLDSPIVLSLNEVNRIFDYPSLAQDFLSLLRFWYEQSRQVSEFDRFRWIVVHSTENYVKFNLNQSPFNVGIPIQLPPFTIEQVEQLLRRHKLTLVDPSDLVYVMKVTGGHPYLVRLLFYSLCRSSLCLKDFLDNDVLKTKIYKRHLQKKWGILQQDTELFKQFQELVSEEEGLVLEPRVAYKLESLGLVNIVGDRAQVSCELYRDFFLNHAFITPSPSNQHLEQLEQENQKLKQLIHTDSLTQVANRRLFDSYLENEWNRCLKETLFISLVLVDIDCFKEYNDTYGHQEGDRCLQKVARKIAQCLNHTDHLLARYGGEEFAIILSGKNPIVTLNLAEDIMEAVKSLKIENINSKVGSKIVTISLGIASIIPYIKDHPDDLFKRADQALYQSKEKGRDQVTLK